MRAISFPYGEIQVFNDAAALSLAASQEFQRVARKATEAQGKFRVALAGGSTPKAMFQLLAAGHKSGADAMTWDRVEIFFGDERYVPSEDAESNFRMARETLLAHVPIPSAQVHRVKTELEPSSSAADYERQVRSVAPTGVSIPRFDLILLGMGPDGHTASLFPGTAALAEDSALVVANWVPQLSRHRITFTLPLINAAAEVLFVAGGKDKTTMLRNVLCGDPTEKAYPAQLVRPNSGRLIWMVDEAAAGML